MDDKVLKTLSRKDLTLLLNRVEDETTIKWQEANDGFVLSGTLEQVTDSQVLLGEYLKSGGSRDEENQVEEPESAELKPQHYETTQKKENLISRRMSVTHGTEAWNSDDVEEKDAGFDDKRHLEHMLG